MTSRSEVENYRRTLMNLVGRAQRDVRTLISRFDLTEREAVKQVLLDWMPELVDAYGDVAATVAADFYEVLREEAGIIDNFAMPIAETPQVEQTQASTRWALGRIFVADEALDREGFVSDLLGVTDRLVKQPARDTLAAAVASDPSRPRFARIPTGAVTCKFCAMLASRGAVYHSEQTAGAATNFHDHCDCVVAPIFEGQATPAGYDPDHYLKFYRDQGGASIDLGPASRQVYIDHTTPLQ